MLIRNLHLPNDIIKHNVLFITKPYVGFVYSTWFKPNKRDRLLFEVEVVEMTEQNQDGSFEDVYIDYVD